MHHFITSAHVYNPATSQPSSSILIIHAKYYVTRLLHASQHIFLDSFAPLNITILSSPSLRRGAFSGDDSAAFIGLIRAPSNASVKSIYRQTYSPLPYRPYPPRRQFTFSSSASFPLAHSYMLHVCVCVYIYIYIPRPSATSSRIEFQCGRDLSTSLSTSPVFSVFNSLILHPTFHSLHGKVFGLCFPIIPTDDKN